MGEVPGCNFIPKSTILYGGNPSSSFIKTSSYSQTTRDRSKSGLIVKPGKNSIFLKKGKTVISVENRKFSRSQMMKRTAPLNSSCEI